MLTNETVFRNPIERRKDLNNLGGRNLDRRYD